MLESYEKLNQTQKIGKGTKFLFVPTLFLISLLIRSLTKVVLSTSLDPKTKFSKKVLSKSYLESEGSILLYFFPFNYVFIIFYFRWTFPPSILSDKNFYIHVDIQNINLAFHQPYNKRKNEYTKYYQPLVYHW